MSIDLKEKKISISTQACLEEGYERRNRGGKKETSHNPVAKPISYYLSDPTCTAGCPKSSILAKVWLWDCPLSKQLWQKSKSAHTWQW